MMGEITKYQYVEMNDHFVLQLNRNAIKHCNILTIYSYLRVAVFGFIDKNRVIEVFNKFLSDSICVYKTRGEPTHYVGSVFQKV